MNPNQLKTALLAICIITISLLSIYKDEFPIKLDLWQTTFFPICFFIYVYCLIKWYSFLSNIDEYEK